MLSSSPNFVLLIYIHVYVFDHNECYNVIKVQVSSGKGCGALVAIPENLV